MKLRTMVAGATAVLLALTACSNPDSAGSPSTTPPAGSPSQESPSESPSESLSESPSESPAGSPQEPQPTTVTIAVNALADGLTPSRWGGSASHVVFTGLGSQLMAYDLGATAQEACEAPAYGLKGRLAETAEFTEDGMAVRITLNDLTSQWGNKLTSEDVKWSFETGWQRDTVAQRSLGNAGFDVTDIDSLFNIIDDKTFEMRLATPSSYAIEALQNNLFSIFDSTEAIKHATDADPIADEWLSNNLADFSGWELESFTPGSSLVLVADPQWGGDRGPVERVVVNAVPDTATRAQLVITGEVQVANGFNYDQYVDFAEDENLRVQMCASRSRDTMMFNTRTGPLSDPRVRGALSMAIDRQALVAGAYAGIGDPSTGIFPGTSGAEAYEFDVEKAKALLADAGYPDGFDMELTYGTARPGPVAERSSIQIKDMWSEIGVNADLNVVASATDLETIRLDGSYEALLYSEPIVIADPGHYAYAFYVSYAPSNTTGWGDEEYDQLRDEIVATPMEQADKRAELLQQMAAIVDESAALISLVNLRNTNVVSVSLLGATPQTNGQVYFSDLGR